MLRFTKRSVVQITGVVIIASLASGISYSGNKLILAAAKTVQPDNTQTTALTMTVTGDMMFDRDLRRWISLSGKNYPFAKLGSLLTGSDLVLGNLEGPVTQLGKPAKPNGPLIFRFDRSVLDSLKQAGFQLVSLANNHTYNHGAQGLTDTRAALAQANINWFGDPQTINQTTVWQGSVHGRRIAVIGWNTIEVRDPHESAVIGLIHSLRSLNDFILVMPHWGIEYQPQRPDQIRRAHALIDAGADAVIGAHPHVVQGVEDYHGHPIVYSLGNFIFDQTWSEPTQQAIVANLTIDANHQMGLDLKPVDLHRGQPHAADTTLAKKILARIADRSDNRLRPAIMAGHLTLLPQ